MMPFRHEVDLVENRFDKHTDYTRTTYSDRQYKWPMKTDTFSFMFVFCFISINNIFSILQRFLEVKSSINIKMNHSLSWCQMPFDILIKSRNIEAINFSVFDCSYKTFELDNLLPAPNALLIFFLFCFISFFHSLTH